MARILVIDDLTEAREIVRKMLERGGHTVVEAANGLQAQKLMRQASVDIIITDILMPDMDGLETIRFFRKMRPELPIIAMTGSISEPFMEAAQTFGAVHGLFKPFKQAQLLAAVERALSQA
jgi:CheY-like chemotaxis protein